jgi:O-acetyl-ADP-ribose deacetylase
VTGLDTGVRDFTIRLVLERGKSIELYGPADITKETTDAIVNASNSSLLGGGGVDGAIHDAAGPAVLAECRQIISKINHVAADAFVRPASEASGGAPNYPPPRTNASGATRFGGLPAGKAVITTGGSLAAKHVIHTVGPIYRGGEYDEAEKLASCHRESIRLAEEHSLTSISFPAISTGAFGYPVSEAAPIAIRSSAEALASCARLTTVRFVLFDSSTLRGYTRAAEKLRQSSPIPPFLIEKASS